MFLPVVGHFWNESQNGPIILCLVTRADKKIPGVRIYDAFEKSPLCMTKHRTMTAKQKLEQNRYHVRRYVQKMAVRGWKKYCFLVPADVATEMYELKQKRLSSLKEKQTV